MLNRIKEAFGLKVPAATWIYFLNLLQYPKQNIEQPPSLFEVTKYLEYHEEDLKKGKTKLKYNLSVELRTSGTESQLTIFMPSTVDCHDYP